MSLEKMVREGLAEQMDKKKPPGCKTKAWSPGPRGGLKRQEWGEGEVGRKMLI